MQQRHELNASTPFALFAYLWGLSALFDLIPKAAWFDSPAHTLLACSALLLLLRPTSLLLFGLFNLFRLAAFVQDSPHTPNHQVLFATASAAILCAAIPLVWRERKAPAGRAPLLTQQSWLTAFAPLLRLMLVAMYFFAVLHKLNWAYFDPSVSCAVNTFARLAPSWLWALYPAGDPAAYVLIFASLAAEAGLPILLCFGRTRLLAVAAGVLFHSFLGLGYFHFSTGLFALYSLFIPLAASSAASSRVATWQSGAAWRRRVATPTAIGLLGIGLTAAMTAMGEVDRLTYRLLRYVWIAGMVAGFAVLVRAPAEWPHWQESLYGQLRDVRLGFVFPTALAFFALAPYLGLRTVPSFSMFSNLRTEGGISNHLFMPATALHLANYQDDLVTIEGTNRPVLKRWAEKGRLRTFYQLRGEVQALVQREREAQRRLDLAEPTSEPGGPKSGKPRSQLLPIVVHFDRGGTRYTLRNAGENAEIMAEIGWLERKWMNFRPVPGERSACTW